jgi:hypothetical protein
MVRVVATGRASGTSTARATGTTVEQLYLAAKAAKLKLPPPTTPEDVVEILWRVVRNRDPDYRKTVEGMATRGKGRPPGSRSRK